MRSALFLVFLVGCATFPLDESTSALEANDKTLVMAACNGVPSGGFDVCRVVEGSPVEQEWVIFPPHEKRLISGSLRIRYRDTVITRSVNTKVVRVPWKEIVSRETWSTDMEAPVQAFGQFKYENGGQIEYVDVLGYAFPVVLRKGYSPLPLNSKEFLTDQTCRIKYTSAGRSSVECL